MLVDSFYLRVVDERDIPALCRLLEQGRWIAARGSPVELAERAARSPSWAALRQGRLEGLLSLDVRRHPVVQIDTVAFQDTAAMRASLADLTMEACRYGQEAGALPLIYIGDQAWLVAGLEALGFREVTRVIFYEKTDGAVPTPGNQMVALRPAKAEDLTTLLALDEVAFDPIWRDGAAVLSDALRSGQVSVADLGTQIVGYVVSAYYGREGYVVRLAVDPLWQGEGIGARLLAETVKSLWREGVRVILLNTQEDNWRARRLYERFGFVLADGQLLVLQEQRQRKGPESA